MRALVVAAVAGLTVPAWGVVQISEDFTTDPTPRGWSGVNNTTPPQNYGYSTGDVTGTSVNPPGGTASGPGEIGGSITRRSSPANFYGLDLGGALSTTTPFTVTGVLNLHRDGGSGLFFGYSNGVSSYGSGGDPSNFLGVQFDDGESPIPVAFTPGQSRTRTLAIYSPLPNDTTLPFSFTYDGSGAMTVVIDNRTATLNISPGDYNPWTHFGIMAVSADGGTSQFWVDDLSVTAVTVIPEPASLGLLALGGLSGLRRRRR